MAPINREEVEDFLGGVLRTLEGWGYDPLPLPTHVGDQFRAQIAPKLPAIDEPCVLAFFAGLATANSLSLTFLAPPTPRYLVVLAGAMQALLPLLDALPGDWSTEGLEFATWDELMERLGDVGPGPGGAPDVPPVTSEDPRPRGWWPFGR